MQKDDTGPAGAEQHLQALEQQLEQELQTRGFDPAQLENIPLSGSLARLKMAVDRLRAELESNQDDVDD